MVDHCLDIGGINLMYRLVTKLYKSTVFILCIGFFIGFILGVLFIHTQKKGAVSLVRYKNVSQSAKDVYDSWLQVKGLKQKYLSYDVVSYGNISIETESKYLSNNINVLCAVFLKKSKKVNSILQTWGSHCNKILFFALNEFEETSSVPVIVIKPTSSWHYLCSALHHIWSEHAHKLQWLLFVPDDIFALPENLRFLVATRKPSEPYYMGHALTLWGENYNMAQSGYVLSTAAVSMIVNRFNSTDACKASGKHWKNEDFYLGKYLSEMGVEPVDTRDHRGRGRFHAYNFNQLLFSHKLSPLGSYYKRSVYPITEGRECCSDTSITFHGVEEDKIHQFYYLLYRLKAFHAGGHLGNQPAPTPIPDHEVWRHFLRDEGLMEEPLQDISPEQFYELSQRKIMPPSLFNEVLKKEAGDI